MTAPASCEVCGNGIDVLAPSCPWCGAKRQGSSGIREIRGPECRTVNLEKNMPTVEHALHLLRQELELASTHGCRVLVLIHGYGSSGQGGAIRQEVQRQLQYLLDRGRINDFLPGEKCTKRTGHGRHLLRRFPFLVGHFTRANPGISIVVV